MEKNACAKSLMVGKRSTIKQIDKLYGIMVTIMLVMQYGTIIYYPILGTPFMTIYSALELILFGVLWLAFSLEKRIVVKQLKIIFPCLIFTMILLVKLLFSNGVDDGYFSPKNSIYQMYSILLSILVGYTIKNLDTKVQQQILYIFAIVCTITVIPSFFYVLKFSDAIRDQVNYYGIIDFQYIYAIIPLICLAVIYLRRFKLNRRFRGLIILMVITNSVVVMLSNFATAMVIVLFALFVGLFSKRLISFNRLIVVFFVVGLFVLIFRYQLAEIVIGLSELNLFGTVMKHRFMDIANLLKNGSLGGSFLARIDLMQNSLNSFLSNPLFGGSFSVDSGNKFGFHDTWITLLGYGGIVGFILVAITFTMYFKSLNSGSNYRSKDSYKIALLVLIIISLFNPIFSKSLMMVSLAVLPLFECIKKQSVGEYTK